MNILDLLYVGIPRRLKKKMSAYVVWWEISDETIHSMKVHYLQERLTADSLN